MKLYQLVKVTNSRYIADESMQVISGRSSKSITILHARSNFRIRTGQAMHCRRSASRI